MEERDPKTMSVTACVDLCGIIKDKINAIEDFSNMTSTFLIKDIKDLFEKYYEDPVKTSLYILRWYSNLEKVRL